MDTLPFKFIWLGQTVCRYQVPMDIFIVLNKIYEENFINLPDAHVQQLKYGMLNAVILCIGETAFLENYIKPKVGMGVRIVKHAGYVYKGEDDQEYRVVSDKDIVAFDDIIDVEKEVEKAIKLEKKDIENE